MVDVSHNDITCQFLNTYDLLLHARTTLHTALAPLYALQHLITIHASRNRLTHVLDIPVSLQFLQNVDVSHNRIASIDDLSRFPNLRQLQLQGDIQSATFSSVASKYTSHRQ